MGQLVTDGRLKLMAVGDEVNEQIRARERLKEIRTLDLLHGKQNVQ